MLRFPIRLLALLAILLAQASCAAPRDAATLQGPSALTALAAGRGSASSGRMPAPSLKRRTSSGNAAFVSESDSGQVARCKGTLCSTCITPGSGPQGMTTGPLSGAQASSPYLYVAVTYASAILVVKSPGFSPCSVIETLSDPGYFPSDVAVRRDGTVAVTNICTAPYCYGPGNIEFYKPGATSPTYSATGVLSQFYFGDFDKAGNFYNDGLDASSNAAVGIVPAGSIYNMPTGITGISFPGGIQVARNGTINIDDQECPCIQIYRRTSRGFGHVGTVSLPDAADPVSFALDKKNHYLWLADYVDGTLDRVPYPAGGSSVQSYPGFYGPIGAAVIPPDNP